MPAYSGLRFDPAMLSSDGRGLADLSYFSENGRQAPGVYFVDVYVNGQKKLSSNISFVKIDEKAIAKRLVKKIIRDNTGLLPCVTKGVVTKFGLQADKNVWLETADPSACIIPGLHIPESTMNFDFNNMRVDFNIPQAYLSRSGEEINAEDWDEGIDGALANWQFSGSKNWSKSSNSNTNYLNLMSGLNISGWRLRNHSTFSTYRVGGGQTSRWNNLDTYVQKALVPIRSDLTMGDYTTNSNLFESLSFRGFQISTDDEMYPDTLRGYAPIIQGVAGSNAEVSIRQNGNEIYRTNVPTGPFLISDLYPTSMSGDLEVVVKEASGIENRFRVPYSSVPILMREGRTKFDLTVGELREGENYGKPFFLNSELVLGLPHDITVFTGMVLASRYQAGLMGVGANMGPLGAASLDLTHAKAKVSRISNQSGDSLRVLYGRSLNLTGTTLQLAGTRYSTKGYYTLKETALKKDVDTLNVEGSDTVDIQDLLGVGANLRSGIGRRKKEKLQVSISQRLFDRLSVTFTGTEQSYWNVGAKERSMQLSVGGEVGRVSYNLIMQHSKNIGLSDSNNSLMLSLSFPLDNLFGGNLWGGYSLTHNNSSVLKQRANIGGSTTGMDLNWNVAQDFDSESGDVSTSYRGAKGNYNIGYGYGRDYKQLRYGSSGGLLIHRDGVTVGQMLGDTSVLIEVPGVKDVPVSNGAGVYTDSKGYALLPYAMPYKENVIKLDTTNLDSNTDIKSEVVSTTPMRGAIALASYKTSIGYRVLFNMRNGDKPIPLGSVVSVDGRTSGLSDDEGRVYLSGLDAAGKLAAKWGDGPDQKCSSSYSIPKAQMQQHIVVLDSICL